MKFLILITIALCIVGVTASTDLEDASISPAEFDSNGLELLSTRYGQNYPGYGNIGQFQQPSALPPLTLGSVPWMNQQQQQPQQPWSNINLLGSSGDESNQFGGGDESMFGSDDQQQQLPQLPELPQQQFGSGVDMAMGGLNVDSNLMMSGLRYRGLNRFRGGLSRSQKGVTTVATPIYAESLIVPKIITQPILRHHMVTQPIVQQQLINQPIVETRQVIQPVIRRIITQPIIQPKIYESTSIQPTLKTETTVQPHLIEQTVVTPILSHVASENQAIVQGAQLKVGTTTVNPPVSGKSASVL